MNWRDRIETTPEVCNGKPCIKDTWVMVSVILDNLAAGETAEAILRRYPTLHPDDIAASLAFAVVTLDETIGDLMDSGLVWECNDCNRISSDIGFGSKTMENKTVCHACADKSYFKCNDCSLLSSNNEERLEDFSGNIVCRLCFDDSSRHCEVCGSAIEIYGDCEKCYERNAKSVASIKRIETTEEIYWDRICSGKTGHIGTAFILMNSCGVDDFGSERYLTFWQEDERYWTTSRPLTTGEFEYLMDHLDQISRD